MKGNSNRRKENTFNSSPLGRNLGDASSSSFYETEETRKAFSERMNYLLVNSIGSTAVVTVLTGVKYSGILVACNPSSSNGIDVILKYPKVIDKGIDQEDISTLSEQFGETLLIEGVDVAELELKEIDLNVDEKSEHLKKKKTEEHLSKEKEERKRTGFRTDVDISGASSDFKARELKKWSSDDPGPFELGESLEDAAETWDQFAVNEEKFGIKSTFDEHLYTTKINKDAPNYETRLKEAERIAKEIESQGTSGNIHLAEDRGIIMEGEMDEEDKYSGVDRRGDELLAQLKLNAKPTTERPQKYIPPSLRNEPHNVDPAILSSTKKSRSPPTSKSPIEKKTQLDELKKFSEKFKVPYKMPEEVKTILKKAEESKPQSALKVNPSLPPKPTTQPTANLTVMSNPATASKPTSRNSKPSTPAPAKADLRKNSNKFSSQSGYTPVASPSAGRVNPYRRRNNSSFFGEEGPKGLKKDFNQDFNMFLSSKRAYDAKSTGTKSMDPFMIERPYFTTPTWISTIEKSHKTLFPDKRTAIQRTQLRLQQRTMNAMGGNMPMGGIPSMMAMPIGPGGSQSTPFMASPGMFVHFQPHAMFYPPVPQMMTIMGGMTDERGSNTHTPSPGNNSPHGAPNFMANGAPMGPSTYPASYMPIMGPVGIGSNNNTGAPSGSSYKGHYHNHNNGNRYHRHR
ncbi:HHR035Cp [Eremothecium sinecaudum]|uniref:HHR035Cp n=1 Tax=Eremothecium sinecaudum TaxID=45286 RepID=A0A0X8HWJ0_9SACH|nr:HHR035Cp [Eremothecium sinecaudum]AMD22804.1 HHR035Cp [Eremothecium sinecaudum]